MTTAEKQQKHSRLATRLDIQAEKSEKNQCRNKWVHWDFWEALQHAQRLTKESGRFYTPYTCTHCDGQHVGQVSETQSVVWMMGGWSETVTIKELM